MGQSVLLEQKHNHKHLTRVQGGYSWTCRRCNRSSILCHAQLFSSVPTFESSACRWFPGSSQQAPVRLQLATSWRFRTNNGKKTITNTLFLADFRFTLNQRLRTSKTLQVEKTYWTSKCHFLLPSTDFFISIQVWNSFMWSAHIYANPKAPRLTTLTECEPWKRRVLDMSISSCLTTMHQIQQSSLRENRVKARRFQVTRI